MADQETIEAAAVVAQSVETSEPAMPGFTAEDLAKARAQEKAKLYPQIEKMAEELAAMKKPECYQPETSGLITKYGLNLTKFRQCPYTKNKIV